MATKVVMLNSGGKDSLALAMKLAAEGTWEVHSLFVNTGQRSAPAAAAMSRLVADKYCFAHKEINFVGEWYAAESKSGGGGIPWIPMVGMSLAAMYSVLIDCTNIAAALRLDAVDETFPAYIHGLYLSSNYRAPPNFILPFLSQAWAHDDAIMEIIKDEPLWLQCIYCGFDPACGTCPRCLHHADVVAEWVK